MNSQPSALWTLFTNELRMLVRDTRTMLIAVVAPLVLFPAFILVTRVVEDREEQRLEEQTYEWALTGDRSGWARELAERAIALDAADPDSTRRPVTFEYVETENPDSLLEAEEVHVVVAGVSPAAYARLEAQRDSAERARSDDGGEEADGAEEAEDDGGVEAAVEAGGDEPAVPVLELRYRARSDFSRTARNRLSERLGEVRESSRDSVYRTAGFPVDPDSVARVEVENVASAEKQGGAFLGLAMTPFLLFLMLSGGSIVAADTISGEKERGTLETLLTSAARRREIVRSKQLAIAAVGLAVVGVNVLNLLVYLVLGVFELPGDFAVSLGVTELVLLLALFVPLAILVSSALLLLSGISKSYKEYQIYFFPLFLIFLVPSAAAALPGMDLRSAIALVPVAGVGVGVREIMVGEIDLAFLALAFASTAGAAALISRRTEQALSTERLISPSDTDEADLVGGPALFHRHVPRWFLGLWVVFFVVSLWFGDTLGIRGQVFVNLVVIFFGGSLLMVRRYRLDPREAFNLRAPPAAAWLATLVGAPSTFVLGIGLAEAVNTWLFPVPQQVIEAFGESLVGGGEFPLWQLVLFVTIMPGIFEELAFRGVLVHGLKKRLRPVALALAVGLIFGVFHVSLFRILPTAWLGVVLTAVTLLTGSVFPAMLWHFLNNAIALVPTQLGWVSPDATLPTWAYPAAAVGAAVAFAILWLRRRPLPGLKRQAPERYRN